MNPKNFEFPSHHRYFLETYLEKGEANIIKVIDDMPGEPCVEIILRSKQLILNLEENTIPADGSEPESLMPGDPLIIDEFEFYKDPLEGTVPLNEEDVTIWYRRPLTDEEIRKISPFLI